MNFCRTSPFAALLLGALAASAWGATYTVNSAADFNALPRLNAGDIVEINSGTYGAINKTLESSIADDTTAKTSPILVYAKNPGGAVVDAPSKITLSGRGIILAGLDFGPNSGIPNDGSGYILGTASGSRYMTLSNIRFNGCAAGAADGHWLYIQGFYCAVEFCTFTERPVASSNSTVSFMPNVAEGGVTVPRLHRLSYCYFGPRYVGTANGFEAIRIGVGDTQTFDMQVTVEHNLFYRSIWRNDLSAGGEPEIISNKSKGNKILNNTILESQGGICLRAGDNGTVEGNFIFGAGSISGGTNIVLGTALASQNGIRVIGQNHVVRNNYIENITGTDVHAALCLMSGESDYYPGNPATGATNSGSYAPAHNAQIYNNTFVNCYEINLGFLSSDSYTNSSGAYVAKSPTNVLFYNNAWQGNGRAASALTRDTSSVSGYTPIVLGGSGGNFFYETQSSKLGWTNGVSNSTFTAVTNAGVSSNFDNYKVPTSTSPLLNKATNTLVAAYDVRGLARPTNNQDIGSFEREVAGSGYKPLLRTNVGTGFDGGPTNSYPTPGSGDSKPTILTSTLQGAALGVAYSQTLQASGGDGLLTWTVSAGSLPAGLSLLPGSGVISGTPSQSGSYTFTARVTDSDAVGPDYAEKSFALNVSSSSSVKLTINTSKAFSSSGSKPADSYDGKTSTRWSSSIPSKNPYSSGTNFGTNCTWIWWDLGENKSLSYARIQWYNGASRTDNYQIESGTNTNSWTTVVGRTNSQLTNGYETVNFASAASGRYVRLISWGNSSSNGFTGISEAEIYGSTYVAPDTRQTQSIVFGSLDAAVQTDPPIALSAYSLSSSNTLTGLSIAYESSDPAVATVEGSTVTINGSGSTWITATQSGDTNYQAAAPVQQLLSVTSVSPEITSAASATAVRGLPFRYQVTAVREPTSYGASGLPAGLALDTVSGKISGTPTVSGLFAVTLTAANSAGTGSTNLNLNVVEPYVYETFEAYTNGLAVPLVSPSGTPSGIKASGQITNAAGNATIGGTNGKTAWFNDASATASAQLEFNAGASAQTYLAASFELLNNAAPSASGTMPLDISFAAWNTANATAGGSSAKRIGTVTFNQFGSLTAPSWYVKNSATLATNTYAVAGKQLVHLFANDHDANAINYVGPDGNVRTLATNSFAVFLNSNFVGMYGLNLAATASDGTTVLTGNNNLGRLCFNTTSGNTGNWLVDNVVVSDMPTDVSIPAPAVPLITSAAAANGQAGSAFSYQTTTSELADSFVCDGTLPANVAFNASTGLISGTPNQSGVFPVTVYAVNSAGSASLDVTLTISAAPPNVFSGSDPSLNTAASWSLNAAPNASSSGGSYTDLVFSSSATNLTTSSGNINGKSYNVTNGSSYALSSVRTNADSGTVYKLGSTGTNDVSPFTNAVTGTTNEMAFLTNGSSLTFSPQSASNSIAASIQLRNSGTLRVETGSALHIPCNITESASGTSLRKTGAGKVSLSGTNAYTGATTIEAGVLALGGAGASAITMKSGTVLEIALGTPGAASATLAAPLVLEAGSKVRVAGTPLAGSNYTLVSTTALTNAAALETPISGFQLTASNNTLVLQPAAIAAPAITSSLSASGTAGSPFSYQIAASENPASFGASNLPAGLNVNTNTGLISGTPQAAGTNTVTIYASNSGGTASANLVLTIDPAAPVITSELSATGTAGSPFSYQISASNSPSSFGASNLPAGLGVNTNTGLISGTPQAAGTNTVTIYASNVSGTASASLTLAVSQAVLSTNAGLANLLLSSGSLDPAFDGGTTSYTATVSNLLAIRVTPVLSQSNATVRVNGANVASGSASESIRLLPGTNMITNVVTAQDGISSKTYTIAVVQSDEFDGLRARWQSTLISNGLAASSASSIGSKAYGFWKTNAATLNTNATVSTPGLWSDLPMTSGDATASGNMVTSFSRLYKMAQAYSTPGCTAGGVTLTGNAELAAAIVSALDWMTANVYKTSGASYGNWFDWEVQGAQYFADAQALLYAQLSEAQLRTYAAAIDNYGPNSANMQDYFFWGALTGANTTSVALVAAVDGIVVKDAAKIAQINAPQGVPKVFNPVTDGDGFYADGSYIFHGNVPYNGHYGMVMLEGVTTLAGLLDGSTWTIYDPAKFPNVYDWITGGFQPFFYHGSFMDCVRGRSVGTSGETGPDVGAEVLGLIREVASYSTTPTNLASAFGAFASAPHPAAGQYGFPNMDRVVAHRTNFSLAVSMSSTRVNNYEDLFGDANTHGYFQGDGMTYLYVGSADTQFLGGYWPSVDYRHLTGTTTEQGTTSTPSAPDQDFVGSADVQDGDGVAKYGLAAYSLHPVLSSGTSTLFGKKSYFMFENEVVCLGAGITCGSSNEVHTTVENRALGTSTNTAVLWVNGAPTARVLGSGSTLTNVSSCAIDGVGGYCFFNSPGNLQAAFEQNSGTWGAIHPGDSDTATYTNNYLKLYYKHGARPTNASYAYAILPEMSASSVTAYARNPQATVISNTSTVQAVKNRTLGTVGAVFWANSGGAADIIGANRACAVMARETYDTISVGVSDPSQNLSGTNGVITVTLDRAATGILSADAGVTVLRTSPTIQLQANVSGAKGQTLHARFSRAPSPVITSATEVIALAGKPLSFHVTADNSPTLFDATGLPPGLSIDAVTGLISGTPAAAGLYAATLSAANSSGTGYAALTVNVASSAAELTYTFDATSSWKCPANVSAIQVECWGGGGAGGSAQRTPDTNSVQYGGGGAGGAYARKTNYAVVPGATYYANVGAGGTNGASVNDATVAGGDSWFNSSPSTNSLQVLARGGAGGESAIGNTTSTRYGLGGAGTASNSIGDTLHAGGSGSTAAASSAGGGGSGAGNSANGVSATNNVGATAPAGGGNGGTGPTSNSAAGGAGYAPGGGGSGARASGILNAGGTGGAGRVVLTVQSVAKASQAISFILDPATGTAGTERALSATTTSSLPVTFASSDPAIASVNGSVLSLLAPGSVTITATQGGDANYEAASPVQQALTVAQAASGFTAWSGGDAPPAGDLLKRYAIGGSTNPAVDGQRPTCSLAPNYFSLEAIVRTNDAKLSVTPRGAASLGGPWNYPVTTSGAGQNVSQTNVPSGCERRVFTLDRSTNNKIFIRLETGYSP